MLVLKKTVYRMEIHYLSIEETVSDIVVSKEGHADNPYRPDLAPCDFSLFPKLRGCRYRTIEEMKEAVTKVIDMLTQDDFRVAFQKLLEQYNKYIAAGGLEFHVCTINKSAHMKKVWKLIWWSSYIYIYIYTHTIFHRL